MSSAHLQTKKLPSPQPSPSGLGEGVPVRRISVLPSPACGRGQGEGRVRTAFSKEARSARREAIYLRTSCPSCLRGEIFSIRICDLYITVIICAVCANFVARRLPSPVPGRIPYAPTPDPIFAPSRLCGRHSKSESSFFMSLALFLAKLFFRPSCPSRPSW